MSKYNNDFDITSENSVALIAKKITSRAKILELGPANGGLTKYLKEQLNCTIDIVEIDMVAGKEAAIYAERAFLGKKDGDIENFCWYEALKEEKYDYIIIADVLEHLYNPTEVLVRCRKLLNDSGRILVSVPNIAHNAILVNLYYNQFNYTDTGLLDDTHIRFWGINNLKRLIKDLGLLIDEVKTVNIRMEDTEQSRYFPIQYEELLGTLSRRQDGDVYQYIIELSVDKSPNTQDENLEYDTKPKNSSNLYIDLGNGYNEVTKIEKISPFNQTIKVRYDLESFFNIKGLRFDPTEGIPCEVKIISFNSNVRIEKLIPQNMMPNRDSVLQCFCTADPMYKIEGDFEGISYLEIELTVTPLSFKDAMNKAVAVARTEVDSLLIAQNQTIQTKEELTQTKEELTQTKEELVQTKEELAQTKEELSQIQKQFLEICEQALIAEKKLEIATEQRQQIELHLSDLQEILRVIENSHCWRMTKPLRLTLDALKKPIKRSKNTKAFIRIMMYIREAGAKKSFSVLMALTSKLNLRNSRKFFKLLVRFRFDEIIYAIENLSLDEFDNSELENLATWIAKFVINEKVCFEDTKDEKQVVDVIVPVFNGFEYVKCLFDSIKKTTVDYNLIIINDNSTEEGIERFLTKYEKEHNNVKLINNGQNIGFVKSVNLGLQYASNHVVIINTDVEVPKLWLERLMAPILCDEKIASVTPFTNSGTICSFPNFCEDNILLEGLTVDEIDTFFQKVRLQNTEIPTGVGFCMAMNKSALKNVGLLDDNTFSKGYGEENDWCQRAIQKGYKNVIAENLFVYHKHGGSFTSEEKHALIKKNQELLSRKHPNYEVDVQKFCLQNPNETMRAYLTMAILCNSGRRITNLVFSHNIGGGADIYVQNLINTKVENGENVVFIRFDECNGRYLIDFHSTKFLFSFACYTLAEMLIIIEQFDINSIYINELVTYKNVYGILDSILQIKKQDNAKIIMLLHDYFCICPSFTLLDWEGVYCQTPSLKICETCRKKSEAWASVEHSSIEEWRDHWKGFLLQVDRIVAFSQDTKKIINNVYGDLSHLEVVPHVVDYIEPIPYRIKEKEFLTIGILGAIGPQKGIEIIKEMLHVMRQDNLKIKIVLIGYASEIIVDTNFTQTGKYEKEKIPEITLHYDIDIFFIPSIWPETFSYTVEEVISMGLPVASFNLGAPVERIVVYDKGLIISEMEPNVVLNEIRIFWKFLCEKYSKDLCLK